MFRNICSKHHKLHQNQLGDPIKSGLVTWFLFCLHLSSSMNIQVVSYVSELWLKATWLFLFGFRWQVVHQTNEIHGIPLARAHGTWPTMCMLMIVCSCGDCKRNIHCDLATKTYGIPPLQHRMQPWNIYTNLSYPKSMVIILPTPKSNALLTITVWEKSHNMQLDRSQNGYYNDPCK